MVQRDIARYRLHGVQLLGVSLFLFWPAVQTVTAVTYLVVTLSVLLIIPRLWKAPQLKKWHDQFVAIARLSKWMGLWAVAWFGLYVVSLPRGLETPTLLLLGLIGVIFIMLASISNNWGYTRVRSWKQLNMTIWAVPSLLLGVLWMLHSNYWWLQLLLWACVVSGIGSLWQRQRDSFVAYRLGLLAAGLFLSCTAWLAWIW